VGRACSTYGRKEDTTQGLVGKPGEKTIERRWEDDIKLDLRQIGRGGLDWIQLTQDRHL
jgi:hypothetical protein